MKNLNIDGKVLEEYTDWFLLIVVVIIFILLLIREIRKKNSKAYPSKKYSFEKSCKYCIYYQENGLWDYECKKDKNKEFYNPEDFNCSNFKRKL